MHHLRNNGMTAFVVSALAGLATPALAQSSYDVTKNLTVQTNLPVNPANVSANWFYRAHSVAQVGVFCRTTVGSLSTIAVPSFPSGLQLGLDRYARRGACIGDTQVIARWDRLSPTLYTMQTRALGSTQPVRDRCVGNALRPAYAASRGSSRLDLFMSGNLVGTSGVQGFNVAFRNERGVLDATAAIVRDPVIAKRYTPQGELLTAWEMMTFDSIISGVGETSVVPNANGMTIFNTATAMNLRIEIGTEIVDPSDRGLLHVTIANGLVTRRDLSGRFSGVTGIPPIGSPGTAWQANINMNNIDYDMHVPAGTATLVSFDMSGSSLTSGNDGLAAPVCPLVSELDEGFGGADLSVVAPGGGTLGYTCGPLDRSVIVPAVITQTMQPDFVVVPYYIEGADPGQTPDAVYLRMYNGDPRAGGTLIYGSHNSPQQFEMSFTGAYRVLPSDKTNPTRAINELRIDISAAPVVPAGSTAWMEIWVHRPSGIVRIPSSPFGGGAAPGSISRQTSTGAFTSLVDSPSGQPACIPIQLFGIPIAPPCAGDFDSDSDTDSDDIIGFFGAWEVASESSDVDHDGDTDSDDIITFFESWEVGC